MVVLYIQPLGGHNDGSAVESEQCQNEELRVVKYEIEERKGTERKQRDDSERVESVTADTAEHLQGSDGGLHR